MAIQVSYSIDDPLTREREVKALRKMSEVYPINKAFIITRDEEQSLSDDNLEITVLPVWKWLINI